NPSGYFVYYHTSDGTRINDTWHESLEEAKDHTELLYGGRLSYWYEVPEEEEEDPVAFALHKIQPRWEFPGGPQATRLVASIKDDPETQHPWAQETVRRPPVMLLIERGEEGFTLYHYTRDGSRIAGTKHESLADAQHQATYEFGDLVSEWRAVPED